VSTKVIRFAPGLRPVIKHQEHDQSSHGNWATGTPQGGNNLSHREIYNLMAGQPDPKKSAVYKAEEKHSPVVQQKLEKPFPPNGRGEYATREEYDAAYKKYSKAFDEWSRETSRNIQSDSAKATLDGTRAGVQKYIDTVTKADWFVEAFGRGGSVGTPKVALRDSQTAGTYTIGTKNGQPYSAMVINKGFSLNEPTILHEITHYATAISATKGYQPHGTEFAKNHVYIASKVIGAEYASGLEKAYREEGIDLGN
jgi:putative metallohydrolase (TIGR04338 family)